MDPKECVNAMSRFDLVIGNDNHESAEVTGTIIGTVTEVKIVGPDEVAAIVKDRDGGLHECWPEDLQLLDPITQDWDDFMGIVRDENMEIIN